MYLSSKSLTCCSHGPLVVGIRPCCCTYIHGVSIPYRSGLGGAGSRINYRLDCANYFGLKVLNPSNAVHAHSSLAN